MMITPRYWCSELILRSADRELILALQDAKELRAFGTHWVLRNVEVNSSLDLSYRLVWSQTMPAVTFCTPLWVWL